MTFGDTVAGILDDHDRRVPKCRRRWRGSALWLKILDDHDRRVPKWAGILAEIMEELARLEAGLVDMKMECARLESAGMWPAVPTESWEGRSNSTHGEARYLRMVFPRHTRGLEGRRKVYVGADPARIADARRKAINRQRWEELDGEIGKLERALRGVETTLGRQRSLVSRYRLPDLGTGAAPDLANAVTKWRDPDEWRGRGGEADLGTAGDVADQKSVPKVEVEHVD